MTSCPASQPRPFFSLVVPTRGRVVEVDRLLQSLADQIDKNFGRDAFEVLVLDQNEDDRLASVMARHQAHVPLRRIACSYRNCSRAKNRGITEACGDWILFPDDDCWFSPGFLARVATKLRGLPRDTALFVRAHDPRLHADLIAYPQREVLISRRNRERAFLGLQIGQIYPADMVRNIGFDEAIGPGETRWPGGEETDLGLRAIDAGNNILFTPEFAVLHDLVDHRSMSIDKVRQYAIGFGAVCRKNRLVGYCWFKVTKQAAGAIVFMLVGQWRRAWNAANTSWYRARGFLSYSIEA